MGGNWGKGKKKKKGDGGMNAAKLQILSPPLLIWFRDRRPLIIPSMAAKELLQRERTLRNHYVLLVGSTNAAQGTSNEWKHQFAGVA